ncbi:MAG: low molecular weight protein-tyrosine-phosphatase [Acidobacteriota bacterium]
MRVLFICSANICRSPVAAAYMRHLCEVFGVTSVEVSSAGILGIEGHPVDPIAARLAKVRGLELSEHRSRGVDAQDLANADEIVVMERRHRAWIAERAPDAVAKTILLRSAGGSSTDLPDPTGGTLQDYERVFGQLFENVERIALGYKYPR